MDKIKQICPSCRGVERPQIPHTLCDGIGLINGEPDPVCNGTGLVSDTTCGVCNGTYKIDFGDLPNGLIDILNNIYDKVNDILEKVNE